MKKVFLSTCFTLFFTVLFAGQGMVPAREPKPFAATTVTRFLPTEVYCFHNVVPVEFDYNNPCTGEVVHFTGTFEYDSHAILNQNHIVIKDQSTYHLTGLGLSSGLRYTSSNIVNSVSSATITDPLMQIRSEDILKVVSQGNTPNLHLRHLKTYTFNGETLEMEVLSEDFRGVCTMPAPSSGK